MAWNGRALDDPNLGKSSISRPWLVVVTQVDPDRLRDVRDEPEYEMTGRTFTTQGQRRGSTADTRDVLTADTSDMLEAGDGTLLTYG